MSREHSLAEAITLVETGLEDAARAAGTFGDDPGEWHRRHNAEMSALSGRLEASIGARIIDGWSGAVVKIAGISSSSTTGVAGAMRNWLKAARKRVAQ